ncbi:MAG: hypothetical protein IH884_06660 [Myxococcales bacterium]|nr:hypothetical protein [Myxococcales bacterium]
MFERLPAGKYKLSMSDEMGLGGEMKVVVDGDLTVIFDPKELNALLVSITDDASYLATVGLRDGDLIIGINGKEFKNMMQMQVSFMGAMGDKEELEFVWVDTEEEFEDDGDDY